MIIPLAMATFFATLIGGLLALKLRDKLHLVLGFSAGAVIGVAFFDLIPESIELGSKFFDVSEVASISAVGFLVYLILDRVVFLHFHDEDHEDHDHSKSAQGKGILGAGSLCIHSFFDGLAIGLGFQVSTSIGLVVAVAVLVHDFSDGINTVGMILKGNGDRKTAIKWLLIDAAAPLLGAASTMLFTLSERSLAVVLALFAGFFLYIGASDLIPESHHAHPKFLTTIMTLLGAGVLFLVIKLAH